MVHCYRLAYCDGSTRASETEFSELEAIETDARYALFCHNQQFQIAVREYQGQARDAVNQSVQESSDTDEVVIMQEIQSVQNRYEGRRVAHMIGFEAREALRGQRNHTIQEHQVLLQAGERNIVLLKRQMHS